MAKTHFNSELHAQGGLAIGSAESGTKLTKIIKSTVSVVIPAVTAASLADVEVTVTGATAGDVVVATPLAAAMETDLGIVGAFVSQADKVKIRFINNDGSNAATGSTSNFQILLIRS